MKLSTEIPAEISDKGRDLGIFIPMKELLEELVLLKGLIHKTRWEISERNPVETKIPTSFF